jgi:DNA-binding MarR family transcriptional regulator
MTWPQRDLVHLLSLAQHRAVRRLTAALAAEGCSVEQWRVLCFLGDGAGRTMTDLADYALMPAPSATKLIDRMVADTLVYRHADAADRRRVLIHLTERGQELHQRAREVVRREQDELLAAIGDDGELADRLARLSDALEPEAHHRAALRSVPAAP